ncbi:hypothetical protein HDU86_002095 [Geranomyces michiganensis]|nr:hypothetical protein HDU86_002095 [Geranomyces michiganensis]
MPEANDQSHDEALAQLLAVFDTQYSESELLSALARRNGDVASAIDLLLLRKEPPAKRKRTAISDFFVPTHVEGPKRASASAPPETIVAEPSAADTRQGLRNAFDVLGKKDSEDDDDFGASGGPPIWLKPDNISSAVPCELFTNILPPDLADALLRVLLVEAASWRRREFVLFDREVQSPHSTSFYADRTPNGVPAADYWYGGKREREVRTMPPEMRAARDLIALRVNERMRARDAALPSGKRHFAELRGEWRPNICVANSYRDHEEGVGPHIDKLTYLGPRPTIGSLTLGAARPFRLRRIARPGGGAPGQTFNVVLPHNSLLIMFPPCQEEYRHSVPKCQSSSLSPHPISHATRLNLTFRVSREEYQRSVPLCKCGNPAELRPVVKQEKTFGRYFYMCGTGGSEARGIPAGTNCGMFEWLDIKAKISSALALADERAAVNATSEQHRQA